MAAIVPEVRRWGLVVGFAGYRQGVGHEVLRRGIVADPASTAQPSHADRRPVVLSERSALSF